MRQASHARDARQLHFLILRLGRVAATVSSGGPAKVQPDENRRGGVGTMLLSGHAHTVAPGEGRTVNLGIVTMRVLAAGAATTNRAFTLAEFSGGEGSWTVPHVH